MVQRVFEDLPSLNDSANAYNVQFLPSYTELELPGNETNGELLSIRGEPVRNLNMGFVFCVFKNAHAQNRNLEP